MWTYRTSHVGGAGGFFRLCISYDTLVNHYKTNFQLMQHHNYSLYDLENMMPYEREIYVKLLSDWLQEEKARHDKMNRG